jgi:hypothetical protein
VRLQWTVRTSETCIVEWHGWKPCILLHKPVSEFYRQRFNINTYLKHCLFVCFRINLCHVEEKRIPAACVICVLLPPLQYTSRESNWYCCRQNTDIHIAVWIVLFSDCNEISFYVSWHHLIVFWSIIPMLLLQYAQGLCQREITGKYTVKTVIKHA